MGDAIAVGVDVEIGCVVDSVVGVVLGDGLGDGDVDVEGDVYFPTFDEAAFNLVDTQHFETNLKYSYRHYTAKS